LKKTWKKKLNILMRCKIRFAVKECPKELILIQWAQKQSSPYNKKILFLIETIFRGNIKIPQNQLSALDLDNGPK
jgi:hypothetical protein